MAPFTSIYFDDRPRKGRIIDIFPAAEPRHKTALFFIHGGGWRAGSREIFHEIIHEYRLRGFDCASTDYRLEGTSPFGQVADIRTGLGIFAADLERRNRPRRVVVIGSSAGAHLALLLALAETEKTPLATSCAIAGLAVHAATFTFEPWEDIFPGSLMAFQAAMGLPYPGNEELYRQASPIHHIRAGNPPIFALHAENEHMFPREQYEAFAARYRSHGNLVREKTYPRTEHGFFYSLERRQQRDAFEDIAQFVTRLESGSGHD